MEEIRRMFEQAQIDKPGHLLHFEHDDGMILTGAVYSNGAFLLYQQDDNDAGFTSRNPDYRGPEDAVLPFILDNGQRDEIPTLWVIPFQEAIHAVEYFFQTGEKAPWVCWHDDFFPQERIEQKGKLLTVLSSGDRVWMLYQQSKDYPGEIAFDPQYADAEEILYEFILDNGQRISYPLSQTIAKEEASRARTYFFRTGEKAPWISWRHKT